MNYHPEDARIRRAGYTIHARPKHGPAMWRAPDGEIVQHVVALDRATVQLQKRADEARVSGAESK